MIDQARSCLCYLNQDFIQEKTGTLEVNETSADGAGTVKLHFDGPAIKVRPPKDGQSHLFKALANRKCADGAFVTFHPDGVRLHIVELKGNLTVQAWPSILKQFEGMFLVAIAICRIMQISAFNEVTCYIAGKKDRITDRQSGSPILAKTPLGGKATFGGVEQWDAGELDLPHGMKARLVKGARDENGDFDFGAVA